MADPLLLDPEARLELLNASVQSGLTTGTKATRGSFAQPTTGVFASAPPPSGTQGFKGIFGITGRKAQREVDARIDVFNGVVDNAGVTRTPEMNEQIRGAFESGAGGVGAKAIVDAHIANSPEAQEARKEEARRAKLTFDAVQLAAQDKHKADKEALSQEKMFMGVPRETVDEDRTSYAKLQQGLNLVEEWKTLFNAFGTEVAPGFILSDEDASAKQAFKNIEQRFIPMFQELFDTGVITPTELKFLQEQFPTASEWNTMTDPERRVAIGGVQHFLENEIDVTLFSNIALSTPGAPLFLERVPGEGRDIDQLLAIQDPPGEELTLEQLAEARKATGPARAAAADESVASIADITGGTSQLFPQAPGGVPTGEEIGEVAADVGSSVLEELTRGFR